MKHLAVMKSSLRRNIFLMSISFVITFLSGSCELADEILLTDTGRLTGYWTVTEESDLFKTALHYEIYISPDGNDDSGIIIDNFYDLGNDVWIKAKVTGSLITLAGKTNDGEFTVAGSGTISINSRTINLKYSADDGSGVADHCETVYTKK